MGVEGRRGKISPISDQKSSRREGCMKKGPPKRALLGKRKAENSGGFLNNSGWAEPDRIKVMQLEPDSVHPDRARNPARWNIPGKDYAEDFAG